MTIQRGLQRYGEGEVRVNITCLLFHETNRNTSDYAERIAADMEKVRLGLI